MALNAYNKNLVLRDEKTGAMLVPSQRVRTFRGKEAKLVGWRMPEYAGTTGRVFLDFGDGLGEQEYYPSVIGAKWVPEPGGEGE